MKIKELKTLFKLHEKLNKHDGEDICECGYASPYNLRFGIDLNAVKEWHPKIPIHEKIIYIGEINNNNAFTIKLLYDYIIENKETIKERFESIKSYIKNIELNIDEYIPKEFEVTKYALKGFPAQKANPKKLSFTEKVDPIKFYHLIGDQESCKFLVKKYPKSSMNSPYSIYYLTEKELEKIRERRREIKGINYTLKEEHLKYLYFQLTEDAFPLNRLNEFSPAGREFIRFIIQTKLYIAELLKEKITSPNNINEYLSNKFKNYLPNNARIEITLKEASYLKTRDQVTYDDKIFDITYKIFEDEE